MIAFTGNNIRMFRANRGWTQEELAQRAGVNRSTIVRIETDDSRLQLGTIAAVCSALGYRAVLGMERVEPGPIWDEETDRAFLLKGRFIVKRPLGYVLYVDRSSGDMEYTDNGLNSAKMFYGDGWLEFWESFDDATLLFWDDVEGLWLSRSA